MEQKIEEVKNEDSDQAKEYLDFIKSSVADGSYFKDAINWYYFRYVTPICDRTMLIFGAILAAVVLYFLITMIQGAFPLVVKEPVFIRSKDQSLYFPELVGLKPKVGIQNYDPAIKTVDEAVAKYLVITYVKDRENYDFSKARIEDVNSKFNRIRNISSSDEYRNFQLVMSKDNPNSPIHDFGRDVVKTVKIESVKFAQKEAKNLLQRAHDFLINKVPNQAEIRFTATTRSVSSMGEISEDKQRYLAQITFDFDGVNKDEKNNGGVLRFMVNDYKLFKVR